MKFKVISILVVVLIILGGVTYNNNLYESVDYVKKTYSEEISENKNEEYNEKEISNLLLLGIDKEENASDTMIIVSYNKDSESLKLVSIMRDLYVFQGEGKANKMNYAYHYGGVEGALNTINNVFNLSLEKYIKVDFESLVKIIDFLGGVDIDINDEERKYINNHFPKEEKLVGKNVKLNGQQALGYTRLRKIDSDFQRTARQRKVLRAAIKRYKELGVIDSSKVLYDLYKSVETNLSITELTSIGLKKSNFDENNIYELRIPIDGTSRDNTKGVYHLDWDEEVNKQALHNFLDN